MIRRKIYIHILLAYIFYIGFNPLPVFAVDFEDRYVNPGVMGKENIDSFKPDQYEQQNDDEKATKNRLKGEKNVESTKYNLDVTKNVQQEPDFQLNKIIFVGNTKVKEKKLRKFINNLEGKKVKLSELKAACDNITDYYRSKGYITTKAIIKTQRVDNGIVEITVDEGKYGDIAVVGNKWAKEKYLNNILEINGVKKDAVLNVHNLENAIGEINGQHYIRGNVIINNGEKPDKNDISLQVQDRLPIDVSADWNDYGTELTGLQRVFLKASYYNLTGYGDNVYGGTILGNNNYGAVAGYNIPLNKKGTKLNLGFTSYNVNYGGVYRDLGLYGNWKNYSIGLSQPLYRGNRWTVDSSLSFDICDVNQGLSVINLEVPQRLRVLRTGVFAKKNDDKGFWSTAAVVSTGLPIMDATTSDQTGGADANFVKTNLSVNRIQILPKRSFLLLSLNGQYCPNELMAPEKLALGGVNGRGYETASVLGDSGVFGTIELRTPVPFLKKILPEKLKNIEEQVKLGYFYDFGVIHDINGFSSYVSNKQTNVLQSVGVGIHFPVRDLLMVNLDLGIPIGDSALINQGARVTFSISSSLQNMWNWKKIETPNL